MDNCELSDSILLTAVSLPTPNIGGPGRVVLEMLKASGYRNLTSQFKLIALFNRFAVDDYDEALSLINTKETKDPDKSRSIWMKLKQISIRKSPLVSYAGYRRNLLPISSELCRSINAVKPLIIHAHEFISANLAMRMNSKLPMILTSHYKGSGVTEHILPMNPHYRGNLMEGYLRRMEKEIFRRVDIVTFPSFGAKILLDDEYPDLLDGKDIRIIYNGIDISYIDGVSPDYALKIKYGFQNKQLLLCVASYVEEKGLFYLINAVSHLRDATCKNLRLLIVGAGYLEERLARQIQQKRLDKITKLVGSVPHNEVIKLLKLSKAFVLPSLVSVFDLAVLEAMAAKTPIITTAVGGNLEMLDSQSALLVPPKDSRTLASAIEAVLDNNQLCSSIANKSRNRVVTHFSLEAMLAQYFSLYEEILVQ